MADNKYISLLVCGRPESNGGFSPIAMFNSPTFKIEDRVYGGLGGNSYFFLIHIDRNQVVYQLIKNNVKSHGAVRLGNLIIAIAVPKGFRISGGRSPYEALIKLMHKFMSTWMTCKDTVSQTYEFNVGVQKERSDILDDLAREYDLEAFVGPYHPMTPGRSIGFIQAPEEQFSAFMADVQYSAFENYSEVVIGETVQDTTFVQIPGITIPRKKEYAIYDNGNQEKTVTDVNEKIILRGKADPNYYENKTIEFTIQNLLDGDFVQGVRFDASKEEVHYNSASLQAPREKTIKLVFDPKADAYFRSHRNELFVIGTKSEQKNLSSDLSFTVRGEEIARLDHFKVTGLAKPRAYSITNVMVKGDEIVVLTKEIQQAPQPQPQQRQSNIGGADHPAPSNSTACELNISLGSSVGGSYQVEILNSEKTVVQMSVIPFHNGQAKLRGVSKSLGSVMVRVTSDTNIYEKHNVALTSNTPDSVVLSGFTDTPKSFISKFVKPYKLPIIIGACVLAIGIGIGIAVFSIASGSSTPTPTPAPNPKAVTVPVGMDDDVEKCDECGQTFKTEEELEAHEATAHPKFICDECKDEFDSQANLDKHKSSEHKNKEEVKSQAQGRTYYCAICDIPFTSNEQFKAHNTDFRHYGCDICGPDMYFATDQELKAHMRTKHKKSGSSSTPRTEPAPAPDVDPAEEDLGDR